MKLAILGGTGKLGLGFAIRFFQTGHEVMIGSRDAAKAREAAATVGEKVKSGTNAEAAAWCDVAVVSVPYHSHTALLVPLKADLQGKMIIDATVPIDPANMLQTKTETGKSAAEETAEILGNADVFAAFQTTQARNLEKRIKSRDFAHADFGNGLRLAPSVATSSHVNDPIWFAAATWFGCPNSHAATKSDAFAQCV